MRQEQHDQRGQDVQPHGRRRAPQHPRRGSLPAYKEQFDQIDRYKCDDPGGDHQQGAQQQVQGQRAMLVREGLQTAVATDDEDQAGRQGQTEPPNEHPELLHTCQAR